MSDKELDLTPITFERLQECMDEMGEDFFDQFGGCVNVHVFGGFLIAKHPDISLEIIEVLNKGKFAEPLDFEEVFEIAFDDNDDEDEGEVSEVGYETLYTDFAEFCNLTEITQDRVNHHLNHFWD